MPVSRHAKVQIFGAKENMVLSLVGSHASACDSDFRFLLGREAFFRSYDSDYDSDSVASENQPLAIIQSE